MTSVAGRFLLKNPDYLLCGLVGGDHVKTAHGIPARVERILTNSNFDNARTTSVALNPSWKLYTASRKLVQVDRRERELTQQVAAAPAAAARVDGATLRERGAAKGVAVAGSPTARIRAQEAGATGWGDPPPPGQHPFSDIIWFS